MPANPFPMKKIFIASAIAVAAAAGVYYSRQQQPSPAGSASNAGVPAAAITAVTAQAGIKEFIVTGSNYSFAPAILTAKKGDRIRIIFKNSGGIHDLKIDEFGVATKKLSTAGQDTVEFTADKAGQFEYYCSVGSHRQMGMKGTLTVQ